METETPDAGEPPLAKVLGIQFGLMTTRDMLKLSVFDPTQSLTRPKELVSARLGLPTADGTCTTCTAISVDECQGHFGHVLLPTPIFHPNHVGRLIRLLRKICLNCSKPRKKSSGKPIVKNQGGRTQKTPKTPGTRKAKPPDQSDTENAGSSKTKRKFSSFIDEEAEASEVIVLSSDEEELSSNGKKQETSPDSVIEEDIIGEKASTSSARRSGKRKRKCHSYSFQNNPTVTPTVVDLTDMLVCVKKTKKTKEPRSKSGVEVVDDTFCASPRGDKFGSDDFCVYCSASSQSDRYPEVQLKVEVKEGGRNDVSLIKFSRMEIKNRDYKNIAPNYWSFVGGSSPSSSHPVQKSRNLLPSEALRILRKIPEDALAGLGMQLDMAKPEALIVECLPVPPNCTRLQEDAFGASGTNIGFKIGIDRATQAFTKLLNKISSIKASRYGRPTFHAAGIEAGSLQALFGQYLREKGAPKAAPGKEKKRLDHVGRVQKRDGRWSLDWLKRNVLGKRSGFSARNVVTGDPYLRIEEIGVPLEVSKYVTYPVRVNRLNRRKLQEIVEIGQELGRSRACGAVRIKRDNQKLEVTWKTAHQLEIGDEVHRHLNDGDLVYINRPPSLHKHSLIALKVHIQDSATFTINPAVCAPLHADFDGDCLHVFVPQTEETKAELHQLMTVPEQILPSPEGKTIIGLSQDNALATHLVTSSPLFLNKELMHQLAMWSSWRLPVPTILKAPGGGGPLWTGKQVFDLTIPDDFSYSSEDGTTVIQDGELLSYGGKPNWLASTSGLVSSLARHDTAAAVQHLDCCQSVLREWLLSHGFSVSLKDFYAAQDRASRKTIIRQIRDSVEQAQCMAIEKQLLFSRQSQKHEAVQSNWVRTTTTSRIGRDNILEDVDEEVDSGHATTTAPTDKTDDMLENVAVTYFLDNFSQIGDQIGATIDSDNSLLAMVRAGSKGSMSKVFQQIGCLGLQLYKGEHLLALHNNNKLCLVAEAGGFVDKWEARGLVRNSLLDGLEPMEFYLHAIAVRAGLLRQSLEVTEPGELFKRLMLFLRDIHVAYDGTVRNKCGLEIIQFYYEGVKPQENNEDAPMNWKESVMPGEAVGILAATAISQPAYQVMLEANHNVGSKKIRPLELIQETLFPRSTSSLKVSDRRSTLRLQECDCGKDYCDERRVLQIQTELQPITIRMLAMCTAIEYIPDTSEEWDSFYENGERQKLRMPWVGHIQIDQTVMIECILSPDKLLEVLRKKLESQAKILRKFHLGQPLLCFRDECSCMGDSPKEMQNALCLHFSPTPKSNVKRRKVKVSRDGTMELLETLKNLLIPLILNTTVKGDDRIESTKIVWEDAAWAPPGRPVSDDFPLDPASCGELVLEVTIKEKVCNRRGLPWMITTEACLPVMDSIDWRRSSPYSVQEINHAFGVEAARDCILQRFNLATEAAGTPMGNQHLKLVADLMVHSGEVHGLTSHGYGDLMRSLKTTVPFTAGAFRAPIKNFMDAGERGDKEILSGVLASCVFGKRVPLGTGADFVLKVEPEGSCFGSVDLTESVDVHECLKELNDTIGTEIPETPPRSEVDIGDVTCDPWTQTVDAGNWDSGGWGDDAGGWGSHDRNGSTKASGWDDDGGGWGSCDKGTSTRVTASSGWGDDVIAPAENSNAGNWGTAQEPEADGWGARQPPAPAKNDHNGWGPSEEAIPEETAKSAGWGDGESENAGAWATGDRPPQDALANGWGWDPVPREPILVEELTQLGSPPKVSASRWTEDIDVPSRSPWESPPPSAEATGWRETPSIKYSRGDASSVAPGSWKDTNAFETSSRPDFTQAVRKGYGCPTQLPALECGLENSCWTAVKALDASAAIRTTDSNPKLGWDDASAIISPGWPLEQVESKSRTADQRFWTSEDTSINYNSLKSEVGESSSRLDASSKREAREFNPTGVNTIPLPKIRTLKNMAFAPPVLRNLSPSKRSFVSADRDGLQTETFRGNSIDRNHVAEATEDSSRDVKGATLWTNTRDQGSKEADSCRSSLITDYQASSADQKRSGLIVPDGFKSEAKVGWSFVDRKKDGPDHQIKCQTGSEPQSSGGWVPKRESVWKRPDIKRETDPRRETELWKELEALVRSLRNILKKYELENRLEEDDRNLLLTHVLPHHPNNSAKVGCGVDYIKVANHMDTRCFFVVRKDGTEEDFSYHKCLSTMADKKNPLLANLYRSKYMRRKTDYRAPVEPFVHTDKLASTPKPTPAPASVPAPAPAPAPSTHAQKTEGLTETPVCAEEESPLSLDKM